MNEAHYTNTNQSAKQWGHCSNSRIESASEQHYHHCLCSSALTVWTGKGSRHARWPATLAGPGPLVHTSSRLPPTYLSPHKHQNPSPKSGSLTKVAPLQHTMGHPQLAHTRPPADPPGQPMHRATQGPPACPGLAFHQPASHTQSTQRMSLHKATPSRLGEVAISPNL